MRISLLLVFLFVMACQSEAKKESLLSYEVANQMRAREEERLIDQVFMELVGNVAYYQYMNRFAPVVTIENEALAVEQRKEAVLKANNQRKQWHENLVKSGRPDTLRATIYVSDSLSAYAGHGMKLHFSEEEIQQMFSDLDTTDQTLLRNFQTPALKSRLWDLQTIHQKGKFTIQSFQKFPIETLPSRSDKTIPLLKATFSRVVFNSAFTKACFYREYHCEGRCGRGEIIFAVKEKGTWKIKAQTLVWIA